MTRRPLLAATAASAALALCAASGTAAAATASTPAEGRGTTSLSLLDLAVGGHTVRVADLALVSDTIASPRVSRVTVTPLTVDGTAYGAQSIDQSSSPKSVGAVTVPSALAKFAQVTSPAIEVAATGGPSNQAGASSLGSVKVLGMPVSLAGALQAASSVSSVNGASGLKTVTVSNLALPSIAQMLGALGLDVSALPVGTLSTLVNKLQIVTSAVTVAQGAVDTAQAAVDAATSTLTGKAAALTTAQGTLTTAQSALTSATSALSSLITAQSTALTPLGITNIATLLSASPANLTAAETAVSALAPTLATYTNAQTAVTTAQSAVTVAQSAVNTAQAAVTAATATLTSKVATLVAALAGVLNNTPLVSLGSLEVITKAVVSSAAKGGQQAEVVGGQVKGLKVMGVDVLDTALGTSTLNLTNVASSALTQVNGVISQVTASLSKVLSTVPSLPALAVPAPQVALLTRTTSTSIADGFGNASTMVRGLQITLPAITLPSSVAVPGAASLPGLAGVTQVAGKLTSAPMTFGLLTLHDQAAFRPAVIGSSAKTGTASTGRHLARTGLPVGVAVLSLVLVGGALVARRRLAVTD